MDYKELFPLKGTITKEILDKADKNDVYDCIGARCLKNALGEHRYMFFSWGVETGYLRGAYDGARIYSIDSNGESLNLMNVKSPCDVLFTLTPK